MPDYLRQMDALVLSSRTLPGWKEQFGRVLIEAMSCTVPVVGSDSGEIPNVVGPAGLLFPEGDIGALRAHLLELMQSPQRRQELGRLGRERVLQQFTQTQVAARTVDVYHEMVAF
jgi:glycosyltransferase involved in cell wall biosynthesis